MEHIENEIEWNLKSIEIEIDSKQIEGEIEIDVEFELERRWFRVHISYLGKNSNVKMKMLW